MKPTYKNTNEEAIHCILSPKSFLVKSFETPQKLARTPKAPETRKAAQANNESRIEYEIGKRNLKSRVKPRGFFKSLEKLPEKRSSKVQKSPIDLRKHSFSRKQIITESQTPKVSEYKPRRFLKLSTDFQLKKEHLNESVRIPKNFLRAKSNDMTIN